MLASLGRVPPMLGCRWSSIAHDRSSQTSAVMLVWVSALGRCSIVRREVRVSVDVLQGAETLGEWSLSVSWGMSTDRNEGSWAGTPSIFMPWTSTPDREVSTGSRSPFNPLGYTTQSPHCNSLHTFSSQRCLHAFLLGMPSIMALRCPTLGRGTCWASLLSHTQSIGPIITRVDEQGELLCCLNHGREVCLGWVNPYHS